MSTQFQQEVAQNLGVGCPAIFYGAYQIDSNDIYFFTLFYKGSIPYFKMSFYDTLNLMKDTVFPLDNSKISIFLNPRSQQLKEILIQFKIINITISENKYNIEGIIDIDLLLVQQRKSYSNLTAHKVLQQIAKEAGVGFNTNISDTSDSMTWINMGDTVMDFMEEIVESSYASDASFIVSFVDYYYNFNIIDVAKELNRNIDNQLGITDRSLSDAISGINPETVVNLLITNDEAFRETNLFFETFRIINNSTAISLESGYKDTVQFYDDNSKNLLSFVIDSITTQDNKSIILKSSPQDENFYNLNSNYYFLGKFDSDNCHKNYNYAWIQNEKNLFDLEKVVIEVTMRTPNFSIYKFQKIKIFLSNQSSTPSSNIQNQRLSGDWLVNDIRFVYSNGSFKQYIKLLKRELELSNEELSNELPINTTQTATSNTTNTPINNNYSNPIIPPSGATSSVVGASSSVVKSILTKEIWQLIYNGKVNQKIIQVMYTPFVSAIEKYGINTPQRICAFLAQINISSTYLLYVEEIQDGSENNNNTNLGNGATDGITYKGRGLIQIVGKNMYQKIGQFLNQDFINNPTTVAANNKTHLVAADTTTQLNNCVLASVGYWLNGSSWGNLNTYADKMDNTKSIDLNGITDVPNSQAYANTNSSLYSNTSSNNFGTYASSSNSNLLNFTLLSLGVVGTYDGYKDRINNWNNIRQYFTQ